MKRLSGLYLVVDPKLGDAGLKATEQAITGGVDAVQLLQSGDDNFKYARALRKVTESRKLPFLINNDVELARRVNADGVHIDGDHPTPSETREVLGDGAIVGYTCGNDLTRVQWATRMGADYVSFCSIFPSGSAGECEIVPLETVAKARKLTTLPIFASGGITLENVSSVLSTGVDGIAIISAILRAPDPQTAAGQFRRMLAEIRPVSATSS